jgi:short-subunit dehydrogenase
MKNTALITGASNGIGLELATLHAAKGGDLVLVARNKTKLDELKNTLESTYKISVHTIGKDLSQINAANEVYLETQKLNIQIDVLINNAGFGAYGLFTETDWQKEMDMIQLNVTALTQFTKLYLPAMVQRKSGKIMNVASTAAFQPGPTMAVYFATKAFALNFSEAIQNEVSDKGVTVTTLCPAATETGFQAAGAMEDSGLFKGRKLPSAKDVAIFGYDAMMEGKSLAIHGTMNAIMAHTVGLMPRKLVAKVSRKLLSKVG